MQKNSKFEERAYSCVVETRQDEQHGNVIEGVPIVFNQRTNLDFFDEVIDSGALDNTDLKDVRFLVNHDTNQIPLARSRNNNANSTMQMTVEEDGMHIRVDLDTEHNARAAELHSAVSRGDVSGMSFMFSVDEDMWEGLDTEHPVRHIRSIGKVLEVSAVTFPAYEQTSINARSLDNAKASLESARETLDSVKKVEELRAKVMEALDNL